MLSPVVVRASLVSLAALSASSALADSARETVYFTTPNNKISRADFASGSSSQAVNDNGTNFGGLAARYDGGGVVTLLAANGTGGGDVRAYRCASATADCQKLGVVFGLKKVNGVALDTFGNLYAVNSQQGGADQLVFAARKPGCPTTTGTGLPAGCFPGGYGPLQVIDSQVDGVTELADVKVEAGSGDVIVLASRPAKLLRYGGADVKNRVQSSGPEPVPSVVSTSFSGQSPSGLALFPTGEIFVVTSQGSVLVFSGAARNTFATLNGQGQQLAIGVEGGAKADPVANGRVLVTVKGSNQVQSFGIQRTAGGLFALPTLPEGSVPANVPFGVADASLSGTVYTPQSVEPVTIHLLSHEVIFSQVNTGGLTDGNYYMVSEAMLRAGGPTTDCPAGESLTLEGITRCVPPYARGFSVGGSTCQANGTGCYYLVFVANTGANVFGGTQQHHLNEDAFGFSTTCYALSGQPFNSPDDPLYIPSLQAAQPRVFQGTDDDDAPIVEGKSFNDITTGCNSHIGRGGQFSMFLTGWDERSRVAIEDQKLADLESAITGTTPALGGLDPHISADIKETLLDDLLAVEAAWKVDRIAPTLSIGSNTTVALNALIAFVKANDPSGFTECPGGGSCADSVKRNAPGEIIARAESARFMSCGAAQGCYNPFP
jgi:hypothetical protein